MCARVIRDISRYFDMYMIDACIVGVFVMLLYLCICLLIEMQRAEHVIQNMRMYLVNMLPKYISAFLLGAYLYITASIALFSRTEKYIDKIDFSLLGAGLSGQMNQAFFVENIVMFIPLGILLPICIPVARKFCWMLLAGFSGSLCIEVTQYVAKWGRFEVVDLWTNTLGAIIGWCMIRLMFILCDKIRLSIDSSN